MINKKQKDIKIFKVISYVSGKTYILDSDYHPSKKITYLQYFISCTLFPLSILYEELKSLVKNKPAKETKRKVAI